MNYQNSEVSNWYLSKFILITGGTGFMGKVLLEKLLRCCPGINRIYLLIRYKRGVSPEDRLEAILKAPLFDIIRKENPKVFEKISLIQGDISKSDLGLSEEDRDELAQNVSVVFHSASTVKFEEPLKYAVEMNVIGTELILQLCYEMKKLEAFIYLSTAYSNCNLKIIEEKVYDPPYDLEKLKMCLECLDEEMLSELKIRLIKGRPNTYSFTKAMAENIIYKHSRNLPVAILRPAVVVGTWTEPFPGWLDNLNGPAGILMSIGKGLLRTLIGRNECIADVIPVDISINIMVCAAWYIAKISPQNMLVFNCVGSGSNPITWGEVTGQAATNFIKHPQNDVIWYPHSTFRMNLYRHEIMKLFLHVYPARIADFILTSIGQKPKMVQAQIKIDSAINAMAFFTSTDFYFENKNCEILFNSMSAIDKKIFNFDFSKLNWVEFFENYAIGTKIYVLKEGPETLPAARQRLKKLKYIYYGLFALFFLLTFALIYFSMDLIKFFTNYAYKGVIVSLAAIYFYISL